MRAGRVGGERWRRRLSRSEEDGNVQLVEGELRLGR